MVFCRPVLITHARDHALRIASLALPFIRCSVVRFAGSKETSLQSPSPDQSGLGYSRSVRFADDEAMFLRQGPAPDIETDPRYALSGFKAAATIFLLEST